MERKIGAERNDAATLYDSFDVFGLLEVLWARRLLISVVVVICTSASVGYVLLARPWYRADVVVVQAETRGPPSGLSQLGGLASLAGVSLGGSGAGQFSLAVLSSRGFVREFIEDEHLMQTVLFESWDEQKGDWKPVRSGRLPDIRDAVERFERDVRGVTEDKKTGLITLSVTWTDPDVAARWANLLIARINVRMRERAITEAQGNIKYLQGELAGSAVVPLQNSVGKVLESEMQKLVLARGAEQYAFKIVDEAVPPKERARPIRSLVVIAGFILGLALASTWVLVGHVCGRRGVFASIRP